MKVTDIRTVPVADVRNNTRILAVGVEGASVVGQDPGWWRIDPDKVDDLIAALVAVRDVARGNRERA